MNSQLKDKIYTINNDLLKHKIQSLGNNSKTMSNIVNDNYTISYHNAKKIISDLKTAKTDMNKNEFEKLGGFEMLGYLENILRADRDAIETDKFVKGVYHTTKNATGEDKVLGNTRDTTKLNEKIKIDLHEAIFINKNLHYLL